MPPAALQVNITLAARLAVDFRLGRHSLLVISSPSSGFLSYRSRQRNRNSEHPRSESAAFVEVKRQAERPRMRFNILGRAGLTNCSGR